VISSHTFGMYAFSIISGSPLYKVVFLFPDEKHYEKTKHPESRNYWFGKWAEQQHCSIHRGFLREGRVFRKCSYPYAKKKGRPIASPI
ncbi:MAG TPA: hypothetical protein PK610_13545, partial [Flavobacteriales bacterium]|nr:hypothetical protein [Flavobacteriales bacterium]